MLIKHNHSSSSAMPSLVDRYQVNEDDHSNLEDKKVAKDFPMLVGGEFSARISSSSANEVSETQKKTAKLSQDHV